MEKAPAPYGGRSSRTDVEGVAPWSICHRTVASEAVDRSAWVAVWLSMICPSRFIAEMSDGLALAQIPIGNSIAWTSFRRSVERMDVTWAADP